MDSQRILKWGLAQTILSAVWTIEEHGRGWENPIALAEILDRIRV